jgi:hypothetical protein
MFFIDIIPLVFLFTYCSEMKFLRKTARYTLMDHKQNEEIIQEIQVAPIINKTQNYKTK